MPSLRSPTGSLLLLAFMALMAFVKAGEGENPYIVIKPTKDSARISLGNNHQRQITTTHLSGIVSEAIYVYFKNNLGLYFFAPYKFF